METVASELGLNGFEQATAIKVAIRLVIASALAGAIGWDRERRGREAGMRTHMLVGLGAALFTMIPVFFSEQTDLGNVVKGVAAGIGFLGAGTIIKDVQKQSVEGLTTAASIWFTAAVGLAVAAGMYLPAVIATILALLVLMPLRKVEPRRPNDGPAPPGS